MSPLNFKGEEMKNKNKFAIVEDNYQYYGLWSRGMMEILEDGSLRNIIRENSKQIAHIMNLCNMCSTRDAMDIDLYHIHTEKNLVYYSEEATREMMDKKVIFKDISIELIFCKASEALKDKVIKKLKEEGRDIKDIKESLQVTLLILKLLRSLSQMRKTSASLRPNVVLMMKMIKKCHFKEI